MIGRAVKLWVGKTPDSKIPASVKLRIFKRENGVCHISGVKIEAGQKWEVEHKIPLSMGGRHAEDNLFPALAIKHKDKTAAEASVRAKADATAKRHLGLTAPTKKIQSAGFVKVDKESRRAGKKDFYLGLTRRPMFVEDRP